MSKGVKWSKASHVVVFAATVVGHICVCFGNVFGFIIISFHGVSITHISIVYICVCDICVSVCIDSLHSKRLTAIATGWQMGLVNSIA